MSMEPLPEATVDTFQGQGACLQLHRDQKSRRLLSSAQKLGQNWAPCSALAKNTVFSNLDGVARLLFILERNVLNTEELGPCYPSVGGFLLLSLRDQGCCHILEESYLRLAWLSNGNFSSIFRCQAHHRWGLTWKTRLFMFLSSRDSLLPIFGPFRNIDAIILSCGASLLVGQHSLLT